MSILNLHNTQCIVFLKDRRLLSFWVMSACFFIELHHRSQPNTFFSWFIKWWNLGLVWRGCQSLLFRLTGYSSRGTHPGWYLAFYDLKEKNRKYILKKISSTRICRIWNSHINFTFEVPKVLLVTCPISSGCSLLNWANKFTTETISCLVQLASYNMASIMLS